ncbi:HutD family protein [Shewanella sp. 10B]|uniref:HutD/Ves family protein n=1 Tax=Shewanella sp. 10B TaxID=2943322 RepID=UPI00201A4FDB|nr:HutD family protein [Shewanella sp. 10B]
MNPNIQIICYEECESSLWKNGGGSTKQLLIWPKGADLSNFDFRISIATISSDGPFSLFNGIDRQLCILEGEGVKLHIKGNDLGQSKEIVLRPNDPPFCFSGETQIESKLLDNQILDFNVMTRRGNYTARIERIEFNGTIQIEANENSAHQPTNTQPTQFLLPLAPISCIYQGEKITLQSYDLLQLAEEKNTTVECLTLISRQTTQLIRVCIEANQP